MKNIAETLHDSVIVFEAVLDWFLVCRTLGIDPKSTELADAIFDELVLHYSEPHRHYHAMEHILHGLEEIDAAVPNRQKALVLKLAWFFHDVIYDIHAPAGQNENQSADFAIARLSQLSLGRFDVFNRKAKLLDKIYQLILATKHDRIDLKGDEALIVDVDLSGIGLPWEKFLENWKKVREEYRETVPDDEVFNARHAEVLRKFAPPFRPYVFFNQLFRAKYEMQARENIKRAMAEFSPTAK